MSEPIEAPGNDADDWSPEDVEAFHEAATSSETFQEIADNTDYQTLSDDEQQALDALADAEESEGETVELKDGIEVEVKTHLNSEMEDRLNRIEDNKDNIAEARNELIEAMAWLIEDPEYGSKDVWELYAEQYGLTSLAPLFFRAVEPALDKLQETDAIQKFREK